MHIFVFYFDGFFYVYIIYMSFVGLVYIYIYIYIYIRYYGQVKKHENVSVVSNLVVRKDKPYGCFGGVI